MPEDTHVIRGINWRETFPFTHIFRSFRVAIHPSKLILALLAILCLYVGGRLLDGMWPAAHRGVPNEVNLYEAVRARRVMAGEPGAGEMNFRTLRDSARADVQNAYAAALLEHQVKPDDKVITPDEAKKASQDGRYLGLLKERIVKERDEAVDRLVERHKYERDAAKEGTLPAVRAAVSQYFAALDAAKDDKARSDAKAALDKAIADAKAAQEKAEKDLKPEQKEAEEARKEADRKSEKLDYDQAVRGAYTKAEENWRLAKRIEGEALFPLFMDYEIDRVNDVVLGVMHNNWFGSVVHTVTPASPPANPLAGPAAAPELGAVGEPGVFVSIYRFFFVGPRWALGHHWFYFALFGILFLIVWAIFGGAIARIAAVHVARDEKISVRQALRFSSGKFLSFVFAPVIPVAIVAVVGLVVSVGGLLLYVPFIGEILVGLFYFLAIAAGFVMTLVALGTAGGLNLMYPTIAVEGSDSFDAISRSFSYVYARPWRMLWYTVVSIVYGAFTFLFVRLFIFLTLAFAHKATGFWVVRTTHGEQPLWGSIWPGSGLWHLPYNVDYFSLSAGQSIAAFFVAIWVFLAISFLGAYLISYYFASSTVTYYLMRREVDATEMDDVYIEQSEDEFAEPAPAAPAPHGPVIPAGGTAADVVSPTPMPEGNPPAAG
jgi:hypothetical protein